jgi:CubicO group peptidase (beta-lactamase class C family)
VLPEIAGPAVVEPTQPALKEALDRAFRENPEPPFRQTKAVVVVHDGRVIAERYAPGYGPGTPLLGWSMTKSVTNALLAILVRQGKLDMQAPAPVAAWADPKDPRHAITPDNLLRMNSGLDIGQSLTANAGTAFDPSAYMVFGGERDMAAFAERAPLKAAPGTWWNYTNGNTLLLSRLIRDNAGGNAAGVLAFAHRELFDKLGMRHVTLEFDGAGTPIGASHMFASARDWAKFGLLYLDNGVLNGGGAAGERILPEGWVDYSASQTPGSGTYGYGSGFWTNRGGGEGAAWRIAHGMPADAFMARGSGGQYTIIVPSQRLVIVRLGPAFTDRDDMGTVAQLVADVIATLPKS